MTDVWTVTQFPPEFPDKYVAQNIQRDSLGLDCHQFFVKDTLVDLQNELTLKGLTRQKAHVEHNSDKTESFRLGLSRLPKDQDKQAPAILETWA